MKKFLVIFFVLIVFFSLYTWFWMVLYAKQPSNRTIQDFLIKKKILSYQSPSITPKQSHVAVLGDTINTLPLSYTLSIVPRKQVFNLSCEFAAATAIIYHFTNNESFSVKNQLQAEKALIAKIPSSMNPNIGIRMGENAIESSDMVYNNLNQKFGGVDYYGVHAPPFIDLFWSYSLVARPIQKGNIDGIKKAIFSGHLVMTWIRIGYGKAGDVALSYGTTPVVKGEHAVVIYGYNSLGVFFMDPGIGQNRFMTYATLLDATSAFPLPFLEVHPSVQRDSYDPTEKVDALTGLDRSVIKILIRNGSKEVGAGNTMKEILQDFGYKVQSIQQITNEDSEGISIFLKKELSDYEKLLQQDISLAGYKISSFSAILASNSPQDAIVMVGE